MKKKFRPGSFLACARGVYGSRMKEKLEREYKIWGARWMEKKWGFRRATILKGLSKLNILVK